MDSITILDGYIDEPTCLGVPPYISPYPRYIAGAIHQYDPDIPIKYLTIDQLRQQQKLRQILAESSIVIAIAGMVVPGRYLSGFPASLRELTTLLEPLSKPQKILCGPAARHGFGIKGGKKPYELANIPHLFDLIIAGDPELVLYHFLCNNRENTTVNPQYRRSNAHDIADMAIKGASIVTQHPNFPEYLICEIETYRGCSRSITGGCSFCSEPSKGPPDFRPIPDIVLEIQALYTQGCRHFRLGNQPCIFSYMAHNATRTEFPRPNPPAIKQLFSQIRTVAPEVKTLHIDNANPGIIARYPQEAQDIAETIIRYHTPGDVAALGVESLDPEVITQNNLKATPDQVLSAIKLLNKVGAHRGYNGLPELLPGLNFIFGLPSETKQTYTLNYAFLQHIVSQGYLLRRINLRQVLPLPGTRVWNHKTVTYKHKALFKQYKRRIKETIEQPLLKQLVPQGTILRQIYAEKHDGKTTFGRQLGSYPLLVGIPGTLPLHTFYDVTVTSHGYRSITALPYPLNINTASLETLQGLPGIGKKRALRIHTSRPIHTPEKLIHILDDPNIAHQMIPLLKFKEP